MEFQNRRVVEVKVAYSMISRAEDSIFKRDWKEAKQSLKDAIKSIEALESIEQQEIHQTKLEKLAADLKAAGVNAEALLVK